MYVLMTLIIKQGYENVNYSKNKIVLMDYISLKSTLQH